MQEVKRAAFILKMGVAFMFLGIAMDAFTGTPTYVQVFAFISIPTEFIAPVIGLVGVLVALGTLLTPTKGLLSVAVIVGILIALAQFLTSGSIWSALSMSTYWAAPLALLFFLGVAKKFEGLSRVFR